MRRRDCKTVKGKIERNGTRRCLSSCLHIEFVCAVVTRRVPEMDQMLAVGIFALS